MTQTTLKSRYTVKEVQAIAHSAGYRLNYVEHNGGRIYSLSLNGEQKFYAPKLTEVVTWVNENPVPVEVPQAEAKTTCATCPFARHLDGDRYVCTASHNHHNPVTRGYWKATSGCNQALVDWVSVESQESDFQGVEATETSALEESKLEATNHSIVVQPDQTDLLDADADYVMQLEASLEDFEERTTQQEQFSSVAATMSLGIEVDSIKVDSYRIWAGSLLLGIMRRTSAGWLARPINEAKSWHYSPEAAQRAVIEATLPRTAQEKDIMTQNQPHKIVKTPYR